MIGIIGAMAVEVEGLIAAMENKSPETVSRMTFWRGSKWSLRFPATRSTRTLYSPFASRIARAASAPV